MGEITDEEFNLMLDKATERGRIADETEPRATSARYDRSSGKIIVELRNGCTFAFPTTIAQDLREATPDQLAEVEITPFGSGLHWPSLDVDFTVSGLVSGIFGTAKYMAQMGAQPRRAIANCRSKKPA